MDKYGLEEMVSAARAVYMATQDAAEAALRYAREVGAFDDTPFFSGDETIAIVLDKMDTYTNLASKAAREARAAYLVASTAAAKAHECYAAALREKLASYQS